MKKPNIRTTSVQSMVLTALFSAIILLMAFTPLGLIDLPIIKATILHVPVIIGAVILGPRRGAFLGLLFALTSLFKNTTAPSLLSFAFSPLIPIPGTDGGSPWALIICFIPRILVGVIPFFVVEGLKKVSKDKFSLYPIWFAIAGAVGSIINTGLVMGLIRVLLSDAFAAAQNIPIHTVGSAIMTIVFANGIPEAIAAIILTTAIGMAVIKATKMYTTN